MFAKGRFGNVVSDDSFLSVACFSFLSNILSICIATKRKNIGAGLRGCTTPFLPNIMFLPLTLTLSLKGRGNYKLQFIQKPTCKRCLKFLGYLIQATFQSVEIMLMQTYVCPCLVFAPRSRARDKVCHPELVSG